MVRNRRDTWEKEILTWCQETKIHAKDKPKRRLNELFSRRNIIAHQTDRTHEDAQRLEITKEIAAGFIEDVEQIVQAMEEEAETKSA